jgi:hypothetical protein
LKLIPQMGASQFRIDMVAEHPEKPGRYVLAIECDEPAIIRATRLETEIA